MKALKAIAAVAVVMASTPCRALEVSEAVTRAPALQFIETKLETPFPLTGISALVGDRRGLIYVLHRPESGDPVVVLDRSGRLVRSWGEGMFAIPHGIRLDPQGNVWTVDAHTSVVLKFTPEGRKLLQIDVGGVPNPTQDFCGATDIAFAAKGRSFISDGYCNGRVIEYDATGKKLREWGRPGTGPGQFSIAHSIALAPSGDLLVADRQNGRIQRFDQHGKFLGQWSYGGELYSVAFDPRGQLYATLHKLGAPLNAGWTLIQIDPRTGAVQGQHPNLRGHELAIAPDGTILCASRSGDLILLRPK